MTDQGLSPGAAAPERLSRFHFTRGDWLLLTAVLLLYTATRLYGIAEYPIYFFCDEAQQANLAQDLVANDFRDEDGNLCPTYFRNVRVFNLGLSVWVQALPVTFFGKTVATVRATSATVGLLGAAALMLALKWFFGVRLWWAGGLVMAVLPSWFLHSRTAFETSMMVGFYAIFILAYLLYREVSAWWLAAAVAAGAATFYTYSNGQGVMFVSCLLLLVVDWRYHWRVLTRHRGAAVVGLIAVLLAAAPYLRFRYILHPEMMDLHLHDLQSYWVEDIPTGDKLQRFARTYLRGISPGYWFTEDVNELVRHRMLGYPYLPLWLAPAVVLGGLVSALRSRRSPAHRLVLIAALASPFSASLAGLRITRVLAMVVPATLAATIGLDQLRVWFSKLLPDKVFGVAVGVGLTAASLAMTRDALVNGPLWFPNYGMEGLQWGARELFTVLQQRLASTPHNHTYVISHLWANNANAFEDFFLQPEDRERVNWGTIDDVLRERRPEVAPTTIFVLTPGEYEQAQASPKLQIEPGTSIISDPGGKPGFYLVRLAYTPEADSIFSVEAVERRRLVDDTVTIAGLQAQIRHPKLDIGAIADAFDGNEGTLARTLDANPCKIEIRFPVARSVSGVRLHLWTEHYRIRLQAIRADGETAAVLRDAVSGQPPEPIEVLLDERLSNVIEIKLSIIKEGDVHIHLREIEILP